MLINGCYCCLNAKETCNLLLFWCPIAHSFWSFVYGRLGVDWVMVGSVEGEIWAWDGLYVKNKIANLISLSVF